MEWISVKDRLPEVNERVVLLDENGFMDVAHREAGTVKYLNRPYEEYEVWAHSNGCMNGPIFEKEVDEFEGVTHWMPLPKPPEDK